MRMNHSMKAYRGAKLLYACGVGEKWLTYQGELMLFECSPRGHVLKLLAQKNETGPPVMACV